MSEQTRTAFEAWARTAMPACDISRLRNSGGAYHEVVLEARWTTWQASRAATLEEAAKVCEDGWHLLTRHECADAIRSLANPAERPEGEKT